MNKYKKMRFNEWLSCLRTGSDYHFTQKALAEKIGVKSYTIGSWEHGKSVPTPEQLITLCEIFEQDVDCFLCNNPELNELKIKAEKIYKEKGKPSKNRLKVKLCISDRTKCWRCGGIMNTAYGLVDGNPIGPDCFNNEMLTIAKKKGVIIEDRYSKTTSSNSLVNVCPHCNTFIGNFYLHDLWYGETETIEIDNVNEFDIYDETDEIEE